MKRRRRRKYLINKSLQLRYMAMVAVLMGIISVGTGWFIYATTWKILIDELEGKAILDKAFMELNRIIPIRTSLLVLASICIGAVVIMFIVHRIAGPLFRVKRMMHQMGKGIIPGRVKFRKGDEFQDLAEAINEAVCKIREVSEKNLKVVEEVSACAERAIEALEKEKSEVKQELKEELNHLKKSLEEFEIFKKESDG